MRQRNVAGHEHLDAVVYVVPVDAAEGGVPFCGRQLIHAEDQVLVALFGAVAGEVLDAGDHVAVGAGAVAFDVGAGILDHGVGVGAVGASVDDGVAPVEQNIHAGIEVDIDAQRARFPGRHVAGVVGHSGVAGCLALGAGGDVGAVGTRAVAAGIAVGRDKQRNFRVGLQAVEQILAFLRRSTLPAGAADVILLQDLRVGQLIAAEHIFPKKEQVGEELTALLFGGHPGQCFFDPFDLFC